MVSQKQWLRSGVDMKKTSDTLKIVKRAANQLGWGYTNSGRAYSVIHPKEVHDMFEGLTYTKFELLCLMLRVLMAPERFDGGGLTPEEVVESLKISRIKMPKSVASQDESVANRINKVVQEGM